MKNVIKKQLTYKIAPPHLKGLPCTCEICSKEEQERTTVKKRLFLEYLEKSRGTISITCEKAGVARATYYVWWNNDPKFQEAVNDILAAKPDVLEDCLYSKALLGDTKAMIFLLSHKHPDYKKSDDKKETTVYIRHYADPNTELPELLLEDILADPVLYERYSRFLKKRRGQSLGEYKQSEDDLLRIHITAEQISKFQDMYDEIQEKTKTIENKTEEGKTEEGKVEEATTLKKDENSNKSV